MNQVKVNVKQLLRRMRENLDQHKNDIAELMSERRLQVNEHYQEVLDKMNRDIEYQPKNVDFPLPQDHSASYERAIEMAEMSVDEEMTLSEHEFDQLVMDNWHWKNDLIRTSAFYGKAMK